MKKKKLKKVKGEATEAAISKRYKLFARYKPSAHFHHPPLKKSDFKNNFLKKVSPDAPKSFAWGLVYGNVTKVSF